jgi:hypothetical protein
MDDQTKDALKEGVILLVFHIFILLLGYVCILQIKEQNRYNASQRIRAEQIITNQWE